MSKASVPYDEVAGDIYLKEPELAADMLNSCLADGSIEEFMIALRQITRACGGMQNVAKLGGLHEKTLYKSLAPDGNPTLKTLVALADVLHMRLAFMPKVEAQGEC